MRILQLHHFYADRGGEDAVVEAEGRELAKRGHTVELLASRSQDLPLGGALDALKAAANAKAARRLEAALEAFKPDIVHAHNLFPGWGVAPLTVLIRRRQAAVQTLHNFRWLCAKATRIRDGAQCTLCAGGNYWQGLRYACFRNSRILSAAYGLALHRNRRQRLAERAFGRFICVSDFVRQAHESSGFGLGRLALKGGFVDEAAMEPAQGGEGPIFVGRLAEEKGFAVLAEAMASLPGAVLKVAGDSPERAAWEATLGSRARFLGRLEPARLKDELRRSAFFVAPSLITETFGLAALEAMASGLAVVASDAGGLPELVKDGVNGLVVPQGDPAALAAAMRRLLEDPGLARAMGARGLEMAKAQLAPRNMQQLESIYQEAIKEPAAS